MKKKNLFILIVIFLITFLFFNFSCQMPEEKEDKKEEKKDDDEPVIPTFTINFDKNDDGAVGTMPTQSIASGSSANLTANAFTKANWSFVGWATTNTGAVAYTDQSSYTMGSANVKLYAKWTVNDYTITFDKNYAYAKGTMSDQTIASGSSANLTACVFINTGFTFVGWATTPTGSVEYVDQASYTMGTSNVTLYAKWTWADYNLRDIGPAGGWIFYINPNAATDGWKYLESAPADQISRVWGTYEFTVIGADGTAIGTGKQNTLDIIANDTGTSNKAADECANYSIVNSGVTYDDWFLPSKDELYQMYVNLKAQGVGGFADEVYWSSSEFDARNAWGQYFGSGDQYGYNKFGFLRVRGVRAF